MNSYFRGCCAVGLPADEEHGGCGSGPARGRRERLAVGGNAG